MTESNGCITLIIGSIEIRVGDCTDHIIPVMFQTLLPVDTC